MKFLAIVLFIRFAIELISNKKIETNTNDVEVRTGRVFHPAEFLLR